MTASDSAGGSATQPPVDSLTFEQALAELEEIVRVLESGDAPLEQSIAIYERGAQLRAHCEATLRAAQMRVDKIVLNREGGAETQPFDPET